MLLGSPRKVAIHLRNVGAVLKVSFSLSAVAAFWSQRRLAPLTWVRRATDLRRKAHYDLNKDLWRSKPLCALASSIP